MADDLSPEQNELLLQFQAITNKDSLEECRTIMGVFNWDIQAAVNAALEDPGATASAHSSASSSRRGNYSSGASSSSSSGAGSSSAYSSRADAADDASGILSSTPARSAVNARRPAGLLRLPMIFERAQLMTSGPMLLRLPVNMSWALVSFVASQVFAFINMLLGGSASDRGHSDPSAAASRFVLNFDQKYGSSHPRFHEGSFASARSLAEREQRFLFVYLHCTDHQDTDAFCRQTMSSSALSQFLADNRFVIWAADVADREAYELGVSLNAASYPFVAVLARGPSPQAARSNAAGRWSTLFKSEEMVSATALVGALSEVVERYGAVLERSRREREARDQARLLKEQQDREYEEAVRAEQESERRKQEELEAKEREERRVREEEARAKAEAEERARQQAEALQKRKESKTRQLKPEPTEGELTLIAFTLPTKSVTRRFLASETVGDLYDFVDTETDVVKYVLLTPMPRTAFADRSVTLKEAQLFPRARLHLEEIIDEDEE